MFRRSSAGATDGEAQETAAENEGTPAKSKSPAQAGKGRPTPKRSEAERNRYRSITGGTSSGRGSGGGPARARTPEDKARARAERERRMSAMRRGEEWALGPRDRGPVRRLARDYVDSRRRISEYFMYMVVVLLALLFWRNTALESYFTPFILVLIVVFAVEGYFMIRGLKKLLAVRYPGESARGLTLYAVMRMAQIRRLRFPLPQVKPGAKI